MNLQYRNKKKQVQFQGGAKYKHTFIQEANKRNWLLSSFYILKITENTNYRNKVFKLKTKVINEMSYKSVKNNQINTIYKLITQIRFGFSSFFVLYMFHFIYKDFGSLKMLKRFLSIMLNIRQVDVYQKIIIE